MKRTLQVFIQYLLLYMLDFFLFPSFIHDRLSLQFPICSSQKKAQQVPETLLKKRKHNELVKAKRAKASLEAKKVNAAKSHRRMISIHVH